MDFILGIINCDYDREEVQEVFSLQGKRSFHHYEIQNGAIFSTCPAVDGEIILGIEKCQYQRIRFSPSALEIENDDYGHCESCGVEIGIRRLEARPTATLCIDCKTIAEIKEKQMAA